MEKNIHSSVVSLLGLTLMTSQGIKKSAVLQNYLLTRSWEGEEAVEVKLSEY